jgi:glycosyltransferase involved in cell wall biosynthesis
VIMIPSISIVIPTRRDAWFLIPLLDSLKQQTHQAHEIIIVIDKYFDNQKEYNSYCSQLSSTWIQDYIIISHINNPTFMPSQWVSYVRNAWIKSVKSDLTLCIDDDNAMDSDFLYILINERDRLSKKYPKLAVLAPTERKGRSNDILSQWFAWYDFWLARPHRTRIPTDQDHAQIQLVWSNCFLATTSLMQQYWFDQDFPFVAEDLDMSYSLYQHGYTLVTTHKVHVYHLQRPKNALQEAYVGDPDSSYQKGKNRILFAYKHGSRWQQRIFFSIGLPGNTFRLSGKIILSQESRSRKQLLIKALWQGTRDGLRRYQSKRSISKHPKHNYY